MATKRGPTSTKRQRERARQERHEQKAKRRAERQAQREAGVITPNDETQEGDVLVEEPAAEEP